MDNTGQGQSEFNLIEDILNGNRESYRLIVDRYSPMVFHVVRKFEKDEDEVNELAQQIFVKAYEKLDSFNRRSRFSSWLYILAANHCRDYVKDIRRSNQRFGEMEDDFLERHMVDQEPNPSRELEETEWNELLKRALDHLSRDYSEPFLLKYRDGMSYEVMSDRLGVSVSALKVRVHRARKELRTFIKKQM